MKLRDYKNKGKTYIIAEIGQAHDGSFGILMSLVEAAANAGVDAVKFQTHIAEAESSPEEPFRVKFSQIDDTRYQYWQRMELSFERWQLLKAKCAELGVEFLATPFSNAAVDLLLKLGVDKIKVGSGDANNALLMRKLAASGKEIILSTGLATPEEIRKSIKVLEDGGAEVALLHCVTRYPAAASELGLTKISKMLQEYDCPIGLSDHSAEVFSGLASIALGASIVEVHITFDKMMFGPDAKASLNIAELRELVYGARFLEQALPEVPDTHGDAEKSRLRDIFGKALAVNCHIESGEAVTEAMLEGKKPASAGIPVNEVESILGKKVKRDLCAWEFIKREDLE